MDGRPTVRRNLGHWLVHVPASAAASFLFAYRGPWGSPPAVVGMLVGVACFVALYTWVWSTDWFHQHLPPGSAGWRALLYGTRVRSALGLLGFLSVLLGGRPHTLGGTLSVFFLPDFWAGLRACTFITALFRLQPSYSLWFHLDDADTRPRAGNVFFGDINSLVPTFLATIAEGLLLTVVLLAIAGLCRVLIGAFAPSRPTPQPAAPAF